MTLRPLSGTGCTDGDTCPTIFERDAHIAIVQGYIVERDPPPGYATVEIPADILIKAAVYLKEHRSPTEDDYGPAIHQTADHTLIVQGRTIPTGELKVPAGERAVAVPVRVLIQTMEGLMQYAA